MGSEMFEEGKVTEKSNDSGSSGSCVAVVAFFAVVGGLLHSRSTRFGKRDGLEVFSSS